ncbi:MAG: hypothetical protein JWO36_3682 [Myxococcales bacterium]|nr:hypothetical protein [Myxococcales bacterium]
MAHIDGTAGGELGFRFGEPLDLDGDGIVDVVGGERRGGPSGFGEAGAWTELGVQLAHWDGEYLDGLFGHIALAVPDLDGDGLADVIVSAPNAVLDGGPRGIVDAYGAHGRIWRATGALYDGLGWHIARAGDLDGDGLEDLWVGAPSNPSQGHVYLLSGRDGHVLVTIGGTHGSDQFGWYVVPIGDLDGDGKNDVAIGAPAATIGGAERGAVTLASSATGLPIREIIGDIPDHLFGQMLAPLDDVDGDGIADLVIAAPGGKVEAAPGSSEVNIISGATGKRLHLLTGIEDGELYGRMLATIDDLDGDGFRDLAIGSPWWHGRDGRIEIRSSRSLALLAEVRGVDQGWFGWHITRIAGGFVASKLHANADAGAIEVHEFR